MTPEPIGAVIPNQTIDGQPTLPTCATRAITAPVRPYRVQLRFSSIRPNHPSANHHDGHSFGVLPRPSKVLQPSNARAAKRVLSRRVSCRIHPPLSPLHLWSPGNLHVLSLGRNVLHLRKVAAPLLAVGRPLTRFVDGVPLESLMQKPGGDGVFLAHPQILVMVPQQSLRSEATMVDVVVFSLEIACPGTGDVQRDCVTFRPD
mmetsp:Transcript_46123/g.98544  ORF Transcript_46123/g.98544 Transcript_46123/m.98544 type:complete len:203 (-) Transcript_46123:966-1574(-)